MLRCCASTRNFLSQGLVRFVPQLAELSYLAQLRIALHRETFGRYIVTTDRRRGLSAHILKGTPMLHYAVVFLVIALIAAVLGFGGIAAGAAGIAKILFVVFLILAVASFFFGRGRGGPNL
jgi:uncharacterized membrane protein YtjA (UPF0391 family)